MAPNTPEIYNFRGIESATLVELTPGVFASSLAGVLPATVESPKDEGLASLLIRSLRDRFRSEMSPV
jgi:hypothetical protein